MDQEIYDATVNAKTSYTIMWYNLIPSSHHTWSDPISSRCQISPIPSIPSRAEMWFLNNSVLTNNKSPHIHYWRVQIAFRAALRPPPWNISLWKGNIWSVTAKERCACTNHEIIGQDEGLSCRNNRMRSCNYRAGIRQGSASCVPPGWSRTRRGVPRVGKRMEDSQAELREEDACDEAFVKHVWVLMTETFLMGGGFEWRRIQWSARPGWSTGPRVPVRRTSLDSGVVVIKHVTGAGSLLRLTVLVRCCFLS